MKGENIMKLQANQITKSFGTTVILNQVSIDIQDTDRIALVGRNGAGKTTLLKILAGESSYDSGDLIIPNDVQIGYLAQNSVMDSEKTLYEEMYDSVPEILNMEKQIRQLEHEISQNPANLEKCLNEYDRLQESFRTKGGFQYETDIRSILHGMNFTENQYKQRVCDLSGGQKTRLALSKLLLLKPDLLILDEPTNHLDLQTLSWLEKYLQNYKGAILVVSHDRYFLDQIANKIYELKNHETTVYHGNYSYYLVERQARYDRDLKLFEKQQSEIQALKEFVQKNIARASTTKRAQSRRKALEKIDVLQAPQKDLKKATFTFEIEKQSGNDVLKIDKMTLHIPNTECVLMEDIEMSLTRGDSAALIGPNGIGKSTLLKTLIEESHKVDAHLSSVRFGTNVSIGYYDQEQNVLTSNKDVLHELWDAYPTYPEAYIRTTLGNFLFFGDDVFKTVKMLSGGEKARLSLAKLMLQKSNLLILDEPTNHLDLDSKEVLESALIDYPGTLLFVSHDRYFINKLATKILSFEKGHFREFLGDYDYFLEKTAEESERKKFQKQNQPSTATSSIGRPTVQAKNHFTQSKEEQKQRRKLIRRLEEVETQIEEAEHRITACQNQLCDPDIFSDFEKASSIQAVLAENEQLSNQLYAEWEGLQEQLHDEN